ncbi:hypothetical protein JCM5296_006131 [Sporobolomyces johnsonii]
MSQPTPEQLAMDHGLISAEVLRQQPEQRLSDQQLAELRSFLSSLQPPSPNPPTGPNLEEQLAALLSRVNELSAANQELERRLSQQPPLAPNPSPLATTVPPMNWEEFFTAFHKSNSHTPTSSGSKIKVKEPTPFDGSRSAKTDVNIFVAQIDNYVAETTGWRDDAHKVRVCASYLSGTAYTWVSSYLALPDHDKAKPEYDWIHDFSLFKKKLVSTFGDPDKDAADARRLTLLRQTGAASLYAAEFRRLSLNLSWGAEALKFLFVAGLKEDLKDELARLDPIDDFDSLVDRVVLLDNRAFQRRLQKHGRAPFTSTFSPRTFSPSPVAPAEDRMQIDANRTTTSVPRRGPLTQAEKDYRRKNNLCSYCGGTDHFQDACPALAARGQRRPLGPKPPGGGAGIVLANSFPKSRLSQSTIPAVQPRPSVPPSFRPRLSVRAESTSPLLDEHLIVPLSLKSDSTTVETFAMVDTGSQGNLIDENYARALRLPLLPRSVPVPIEAFDGRPSDRDLTHYTAAVQLQIGAHVELIELNVARVAHYPIILGTSWIRTHDPSPSLANNNIAFHSAYCAQHCLLPTASTPALPAHPTLVATVTPPRPSDPCAESPRPSISTPNVATISVAAAKLAIRRGAQAFCIQAAGVVDRLRSAAATLRPGTPPPSTDELEQLRQQVPEKYHDWLDVFSKATVELEVLADYIQKNLRSGFIRPSTSPIGAPILFIKKKDGTLRLCVDYRKLNSVTRKNRYPLPLIDETLNRLSGAAYFTKLDLRNGYHQLRIAEGDEWKTAFRTRYGHFEYQVMPFGLTNAPAAFQNLINDTFRPFLDSFVVVYLDDILVYSKTREEHVKHVKTVLNTMRQACLFAKAEKCSFDEPSTEYLGFLVDREGIRMDPKKTESVRSWPQPSNLREVQSFLGFANFYRRFIKDYSKIAHPLTRLTKKTVDFDMDDAAVAAFDTLKSAFEGDRILRHFRPGLPIELETDASDFALGSVISQRHEDGKLYPVAFRSRKFDHAELNYEVHDKELLAIVDAARQFRPFLEYVSAPTKIFSDHANLQYFFTSRVLNRRQARWYETISELSLTLHHRPGHRQGKTDALSRRADYAEGAKASEGKPILFFPPSRIAASHVRKSLDDAWPAFQELIAAGQDQDDDVRQILQDLRLEENLSDHDERWSLDEQGLLRWKGRVYIPDTDDLRLRAIQISHDDPGAGHLGIDKTLERLRRTMYFPQEYRQVVSFVNTCDTCFRNKSKRSRPHGFLHPLPAPSRPWASIALDFIVKLPATPTGNDSILVVVDRFTRYAHFIPCREEGTNASRFAQLFYRHIFAHHGLPQDIVSDRGAVFDSTFWRTLTRLTRTKLSMSTAFHPQSDGITERLNQTLEQYLRMFINYQQDDWEDLLPLAQFVYNDTAHSSTKTTPFFATYGYHPTFAVTFEPTESKYRDADATSFASRLATLHQVLRHELENAAARMKKHYDQHRKEAPHFDIGDLVWLSSKNISTSRQSQKLDHRFLGPYPVAAKVGDAAYRLTLPDEVRIHPVFHVSLLYPHLDNPFPDRLPTPPPLTIVDGQPELEVEAILDSQTYHGALRYLVRWRGLSPREDSWEPADNLANAVDLVAQFHARYPNKPSQPAERRSARSSKRRATPDD